MKNITPLLLILIFGAPCLAQGVFRNQTNATLEKVVQDYPSQFKNIRGEQLSSGQGSTEYKSNITIPGAVSTTIIQSASDSKQTLCWQSVLFSGNEFNQASNRFEELFNQIKNTIIKPAAGKSVIINGMYTSPSAEKNLNNIQFELLPASAAIQQLNIDLALKNNHGQWKIILSVYDKDRKETATMVVK